MMTNGDREGRVFYPTLTRILDYFSCSPLFFLLQNKLPRVPLYSGTSGSPFSNTKNVIRKRFHYLCKGGIEKIRLSRSPFVITRTPRDTNE